MSEEKKCYIHQTPTRLSCSSCGKPVCPKCMINSAVGYKCKECVERTLIHIEKITIKQYILGALVGLIVGTILGYAWAYLIKFGFFITLLVAYVVGFGISKAISKVIGNKIGIKIQIVAAVIVIISMVYNPINLANMGILNGAPIISTIVYSSIWGVVCPKKLIAIGIAIWAAVRHFKF